MAWASISPPPADGPIFAQLAMMPDGSAWWAPWGTPLADPTDKAWPVGWLRIPLAELRLWSENAERAEADR